MRFNEKNSNPTSLKLPEGKSHDALYDCFKQIVSLNGQIKMAREIKTEEEVCSKILLPHLRKMELIVNAPLLIPPTLFAAHLWMVNTFVVQRLFILAALFVIFRFIYQTGASLKSCSEKVEASPSRKFIFSFKIKTGDLKVISNSRFANLDSSEHAGKKFADPQELIDFIKQAS